MPLMVYGSLQRTRQALWKLASPLEAAARTALRGDRLPPLWLRRHVGAVRRYRSSAREMAAWCNNLNIVSPDYVVLDVGCGAGAMAVELAGALGPGGRYVGFDVHRGAIGWARRAFAADTRFRFEIAEVASPFSGGGNGTNLEYRFPIGDGEADLVLAKSLFTHLVEREARHYLREIRRTLRPGRAAAVTAFLFAPESRTGRGLSPQFRFADSSGRVRWKWKARPESAVAYERGLFLAMIEDAGLRLQWFCQGFWPGESARLTAQDILLLGV
jgi:SAM-dependent methyltransferase